MKESFPDLGNLMSQYAEDYLALRDINKNLNAVLHGKLSTIDDVEADDKVVKIMGDFEYLVKSSDVFKRSNPIASIKILLRLILRLKDDQQKKKRQTEKLSERCALTKDKTSPEFKVAKKKLDMCNGDIDTIEKRMDDCVEKFYRIRGVILNTMLHATESMVDILDGKYSQVAFSTIGKNPTHADEINKADSIVTTRKVNPNATKRGREIAGSCI